MPNLTAVHIGAIAALLNAHAEDERFYLDGGEISGPQRDYTPEELIEIAETREHMWRHAAEALELLHVCSGEIEPLAELAKDWAKLAGPVEVEVVEQ